MIPKLEIYLNRMPMIASMILFVIGNILYSVLYAFQDDSGRMVLLMAVIARFVVGLSCGQFIYSLLSHLINILVQVSTAVSSFIVTKPI